MDSAVADYEKTDLGNIQIAPEVLEIIAGLATIEVKGVYAMSGGFAGGIAEFLGRKNLSKGVKVNVGQKEASVDVSIVIDYGTRIPELAKEIQDSIKRNIETMTGLQVIEVNVHIHDVQLKPADKSADEENSGLRVR